MYLYKQACPTLPNILLIKAPNIPFDMRFYR